MEAFGLVLAIPLSFSQGSGVVTGLHWRKMGVDGKLD